MKYNWWLDRKMTWRYKIFTELARLANNGELFNKNTNRDQKDSLTVFFWRIANRNGLDWSLLKEGYLKLN